MPADPLVTFLRKPTTRNFATLVRARREDVLSAAYRVLGDADQAEDVTEEVFIKLLTAKWNPDEARKEGYYSGRHTLRDVPPPGFAIELRRAQEQVIRVLYAEDRSPVTSYRLEYEETLNDYGTESRDPLRDPPLIVEVNDPAGEYRFTPWNTVWQWYVRAIVDGHEPMVGKQFVTNDDFYGRRELKSRVIERELVMPDGGSLLVSVRDASGRRFAAPFPAIELIRDDGQPAVVPTSHYVYPDIRVNRADSDSGGEAWFTQLSVGGYQVGVSKDGFAPASGSVEIRKGETAKITLTLSR